MCRKNIILIGGTSFSGSTIIDLILSNTIEGISVGELYALFYPYKPHHLNYGLDQEENFVKFWQSIRNKGPKNVFDNILLRFPDKEYIVDSSKDLYWIYKKNKNLINKGYNVKNVLVWKDPAAFAKSYLKRGKSNWDKNWVRYHQYYFSIINNPIKIHLGSFLNDMEYCSKICEQLGIKFNEKMLEYWNNKSFTLFGSTSTKISLYEKNTKAFNRADSIIKKRPGKEYNTSYYKEIRKEEENLPQLNNELELNKSIENVLFFLKKDSISTKSEIKIPRFLQLLKIYKSRIRNIRFIIKQAFKLN